MSARVKSVLLLSVAAALAACGSIPKEDVSVADAAALPVTCHTREDCTEKWRRARVWVAAHTRRPITATQMLISTPKPSSADRSPSFEVTISQTSNESATIAFAVDCPGNCRPPAETLLGDFNLYLSASNPAPLAPLQAAAPSS